MRNSMQAGVDGDRFHAPSAAPLPGVSRLMRLSQVKEVTVRSATGARRSAVARWVLLIHLESADFRVESGPKADPDARG
jgi:hypothetical protein